MVEFAGREESPQCLGMAADEHRLGLEDRLLAGYRGDGAQCSEGVGHVVEHAEVEHDVPLPDRSEVALVEVERHRLDATVEGLPGVSKRHREGRVSGCHASLSCGGGGVWPAATRSR